MNLPPDFIQNQINLNGERGRVWVESLPALIAEFEQRWSSTVGAPFRTDIRDMLSLFQVCPVDSSILQRLSA